MTSLQREEYSYVIVAQTPGQEFTDTKLKGRSFFLVLQWLITLSNTVVGFETDIDACGKLWRTFFESLFEKVGHHLYGRSSFVHELPKVKDKYQRMMMMMTMLLHNANSEDSFSYKFYPSPTAMDVKNSLCQALQLAYHYSNNLQQISMCSESDQTLHTKMCLSEWFGSSRLDDENVFDCGQSLMGSIVSVLTYSMYNAIREFRLKSLIYYQPERDNLEASYPWLIQMKNTLMTTPADGVVTNWANVFGAQHGKVLSSNGNLFLHNLKQFDKCLVQMGYTPLVEGGFTIPLESTGGVLFDLHGALEEFQKLLDLLPDESERGSVVRMRLEHWFMVDAANIRQLNDAKARILSLKQSMSYLMADTRELLRSLTTPPLGYKALLEWIIMVKNTVEDRAMDEPQRKGRWLGFLHNSSTDEADHFFDFFNHIYELQKFLLTCMNSLEVLPTAEKFPPGVDFKSAKANICKAAMALEYYCRKFRGIDPRDTVEFLKAEYTAPFCRNNLLLLDILDNYPAKTLHLTLWIIQYIDTDIDNNNNNNNNGRADGETPTGVIDYYIKAQNHANALLGFKSRSIDTRPQEEIIDEFFKPPGEPVENVMQWMLNLCNTVQQGEYQIGLQLERWVDFFPAHISSTAMVQAADSCTNATQCLRRLAQFLNIHGGIVNVAGTFAICPSFLVVKQTLLDVLTRLHLFLTELECCNADYYAEFLAKTYYVKPDAIRDVSSLRLGAGTITLARETAHHLAEMTDHLYPRSDGHAGRGTRKSRRHIVLVTLTSLGGLAMLVFVLWILREHRL